MHNPAWNHTMMDIRIPKTGDAIDHGTILEWLVADGDDVTAGQPIYRLETEKTEMDIESPIDGVLRIEGDTGEQYEIGTVVATIE
jgi:pyruvate/2-oxoglutarate dehydrogenase complex dihydrolipoamide acyltransferase (E2) component